MSLFTERIAYKPFEYPEYYTEGWLKQAQAFWLHTEISMQGDVKDWNENLLPHEKQNNSKWFSVNKTLSERTLPPHLSHTRYILYLEFLSINNA